MYSSGRRITDGSQSVLAESWITSCSAPRAVL
jgi:hypothetical protein